MTVVTYMVKRYSFPILVTDRWARSWSRCTGSLHVKWITPYTQQQAAVTFCQVYGYLRSFHQMALPVNGSTHLIPAYNSIYQPRKDERLSWLTYSGWLPTLVVTHQLQVERRTGKVHRPEVDVLPLCHATNQHTWYTILLKQYHFHNF